MPSDKGVQGTNDHHPSMALSDTQPSMLSNVPQRSKNGEHRVGRKDDADDNTRVG